MSGYHPPTGDDDPMLVVRTIGRLAQIVLELRDEYVESRRDDTLDQLERRLGELTGLHNQLHHARVVAEEAHRLADS